MRAAGRRGSVGAIAVLLGAGSLVSCSPPLKELVAAERWPDACEAARGDAQRERELHAALVQAIARDVWLEVHVLDQAELEAELGVRPEGDLLARMLLVRFSARVESPLLRDAALSLTSIGDGRYVGFAQAPANVRELGARDQALFRRVPHHSLTERGMAAFFVSPRGLPGEEGRPALEPSIVDPLPVPLTRGMTVRDFRDRASERSAREVEVERALVLDDRAARLSADPRTAAAITRLRDHIERHDWVLLLPGDARPGVTVTLRAALARAPSCALQVWLTLPVADGSVAPNALFPRGPRRLSELAWRVQ
jgi:hypothetical protein